VATLVILKAIEWTMGLRVGEEAEAEGLDLALHNERGYNL
jgi:Amt family ammonium transporter